jgi:hypothetical protein
MPPEVVNAAAAAAAAAAAGSSGSNGSSWQGMQGKVLLPLFCLQQHGTDAAAAGVECVAPDHMHQRSSAGAAAAATRRDHGGGGSSRPQPPLLLQKQQGVRDVPQQLQRHMVDRRLLDWFSTPAKTQCTGASSAVPGSF